MNIWIRELERINRKFEPASRLKNPGSLEFAAEHASRTADWRKQLAYLLRAILVDHAFGDGNKRTAAYLVTYIMEQNKAMHNDDKVKKLVIKIAAENITNINKIAKMVQDETL